MLSPPVIGPIVGGFVAENPRLGWHFNFWLIFIFSAVSLVLGYFVTPETVNKFSFIVPQKAMLICFGLKSMHLYCCANVHGNFPPRLTASYIMCRSTT